MLGALEQQGRALGQIHRLGKLAQQPQLAAGQAQHGLRTHHQVLRLLGARQQLAGATQRGLGMAGVGVLVGLLKQGLIRLRVATVHCRVHCICFPG